MGDQLTIRVASKSDRAVAAILTLSYKDTITYKYGCSDERFNHLGGMPFLFWRVIEEAKAEGIGELDLGRSEIHNAGLITFKERLGARKSALTYWRCSEGDIANAGYVAWLAGIAKEVLPRLPDKIFAASGRLLYRHMG